MALLCIDGGEWDGCMGCYESDAQTVCCAVCGRELEPYDDVVKLETGEHICSDADCLYAQALQCSTEEELREYAAFFVKEFLAMFEWELFEAATHRDAPFWTAERCDPLVEFIGTDRGSFNQWWLDVHGCYYHPYADELYAY